MNIRRTLRIGLKLIVVLPIAVGGAFLVRLPSIAQSSSERQIVDKIPRHVPIKVKLRHEKEPAVKNFANEQWNRDFELEVTNISGKPIYFLELWIVLPDVKSESGTQVGFPIRYGRADFVDHSTHAVPEDIPILPDETHTFKLPAEQQRGWEARRTRGMLALPKQIEIIFVQLSFGDGTGFDRTDAKPFPYNDDQSSNGGCRDAPTTPRIVRYPLLQTIPAEFLPVSFLGVTGGIRGRLKINRAARPLLPRNAL